jgi:hypothetical protein
MPTDYPVSVRLDKDERDRIRAIAFTEHRSVANMLYVLVLEALVAREAKAAEK